MRYFISLQILLYRCSNVFSIYSFNTFNLRLKAINGDRGQLYIAIASWYNICQQQHMVLLQLGQSQTVTVLHCWAFTLLLPLVVMRNSDMNMTIPVKVKNMYGSYFL